MKCWRQTPNTPKVSETKATCHCLRAANSRSSLVWMPASIRRSTPVSPKAMPMLFEMLVVGRATTRSSLVISYKLLGTREWFVIHHTDCGMLLFTDGDMRKLLASSLKTATLDQSGWQDSGPG